MMRSTFLRRAAAVLSCALAPALASAQTQWTTWTAATVGASGSAAGTLGTTGVSWSGRLSGFQLANGMSQGLSENGLGNNYWIRQAPYTNAAAGLTAPDKLGFVQQNTGGSGTLTFATAVVNPLIAFISVGQPALPITYTFTSGGAPVLFSVLADNTSEQAYWGRGTNTVSGNTIRGNEFSGVIQLQGTFTSVDLAFSPNEGWHGFTVGTGASVVPEPSTYVLLSTGLAALGVVARRRRRQAA